MNLRITSSAVLPFALSLGLAVPTQPARADEVSPKRVTQAQAKQPAASDAGTSKQPAAPTKPAKSAEVPSPGQATTAPAQAATPEKPVTPPPTAAELSKKNDAEIALRKPPPPTASAATQQVELVRIKTKPHGADKASDESEQAITVPPRPVPPTTVAAEEPRNERDDKMRERVQVTLFAERNLPYTARMVGVRVKKGTITLHGEVNTDYERVRVAQIVDGLRGPYKIVNQISVRNRAAESVATAEEEAKQR